MALLGRPRRAFEIPWDGKPTAALLSTLADRSLAIPRGREGLLLLFAMALVLLGGTALRYVSASNDLWLDEIWSLAFVAGIEWPYQIFWGPYIDNNHFLNSLWIYLVGVDASPVVLRGLAIATGGLSIVLAGTIGLRQGGLQALLMMTLVALSYPLVHYASEARGYGPMVFALLLGYDAVERYLAEPRPAWRWLLAVSAVLGVLSHLLYLTALFGFAFWVFGASLQAGKGVRRALDDTFVFFRPCNLVFVPLFLTMAIAAIAQTITFGGSVIGGTDNTPLFLQSAGQLLQYGFGVPMTVEPALVVALALVLTIAAIASQIRGRDSHAWIFLACIILIPLVNLVTKTPTGSYPRYFLIPGVVALLLFGRTLGHWLQGTPALRVAAGVALALFVFGNVQHLRTFLAVGRGSPGAAVELIAEQAGTDRATLGGDHDFRAGLLVEHFTERLNLRSAVRFVERRHWQACPPDWLLVTNFTLHPEVPSEITVDVSRGGGAAPNKPSACEQGTRRPSGTLGYELQESYPFWGLAGWHVTIYRRRSPAGTAAP